MLSRSSRRLQTETLKETPRTGSFWRTVSGSWTNGAGLFWMPTRGASRRLWRHGHWVLPRARSRGFGSGRLRSCGRCWAMAKSARGDETGDGGLPTAVRGADLRLTRFPRGASEAALGRNRWERAWDRGIPHLYKQEALIRFRNRRGPTDVLASGRGRGRTGRATRARRTKHRSGRSPGRQQPP